MGQKRSIGSNDDDDRPHVALCVASKRRLRRPAGWTDLCIRHSLRNLLANRHAGDGQLRAAPAVALDQDPHRVPAIFFWQHARCRSRSALEAVAHHPRSAARVAFGYRAGPRGIEGGKHVIRLDVEAIDVVQIPIPGLGDYRKGPRLAERASL